MVAFALGNVNVFSLADGPANFVNPFPVPPLDEGKIPVTLVVRSIAPASLSLVTDVSASFAVVTFASAILAVVTFAFRIFTVVIALSEITGAAAEVPVPPRSPASCSLPFNIEVASGVETVTSEST